MKLKKFKKYKIKPLLLNLIKLKLYKKNQLSSFNPKTIELTLKKTLSIIYEYHIKKKKILFLEFPNTFKHILKHTKHILISNNLFYTNILNNQIIHLNSFNTILQNKNLSLNLVKILLKLNKKIDLVVVYNPFNNKTIVKKNYKSKTPVIYCFNSSNQFNNKITYNIITNNKSLNRKILNNNLILTMLKTTLKKAKRTTKTLINLKKIQKLQFHTKKFKKNNYESFKK